MTISVLLDVALGLILLYLVLSITASALNEQISSFLQLRAKNQEYFILTLLGEQVGRKNSLWRYFREAIRTVPATLRGTMLDVPLFDPEALPIDSTVAPASAAQPAGLVPTHKESPSLNPYTDLFYFYAIIDRQENNYKRPVYINETEFTTGIMEVARHIYNNTRTVPTSTTTNPGAPGTPVADDRVKSVLSFDDARKIIDGVGKLPNPQFNKLKIMLTDALQKVINEVPPASKPLDTLRKNLQSWYTDAVKRLIGWYTSQIKRILLTVAFLIVMMFNIDSLKITNALLESPTRRQVIAANASMSAADLSARATLLAQLATQEAPTTSSSITNATTAFTQTYGTINDLSALDLPLGWNIEQPSPFDQGIGYFGGWLIKKLLGLGITILAITQGAPFWFDMLNRVTNLRNSGKPPDQPPTVAAATQPPAAPATPTVVIQQPAPIMPTDPGASGSPPANPSAFG